MPPQAQFAHKLVRTVNRLMIESTCMRCGAASLVSEHDGTLEMWEEGHSCNDSKSESREEAERKRGEAS
jgi:hypothetical protein